MGNKPQDGQFQDVGSPLPSFGKSRLSGASRRNRFALGSGLVSVLGSPVAAFQTGPTLVFHGLAGEVSP